MSAWTPCNTDVLIEFVNGRLSCDYADGVARHLQFCQSCRTRVDELRGLTADLADPRVWEPITAPDVLDSPNVVNFRDRFDAEQAFAEKNVSRVFALPASEWYVHITGDTRFITAPVVWKILEIAAAKSSESQHDSVPIFRAAAFVADTLSRRCPGIYETCRVAAWKDLAWALRCIGEHRNAETALDNAEEAVIRCQPIERNAMRPRVRLTRAILLSSTRRFDEALALVHESFDEFVAAGDVDRAAMALEQEANIYMLRGDGAAAAQIIRRLLFTPVDDETRARRYQNLAHALEMSGELHVAALHVRMALELHQKLAAPYFVNKDRWALGRILEKMGDVTKASLELRGASLSMREMDPHSAVMIDLDLSEIEIRRGLAGHDTYHRLRAAAAFAIEKQLPEATCRALLYIESLGASVKATHVRFVRDFISELPNHPHREFMPPEAA